LNPAYFTIFIVIFLIILPAQRRRKAAAAMQLVLRKKRVKGANKMHELLEKYIGKECTVYTLGDNNVTGTVTALKDGWLSIADKLGNEEVLNLDYIVRVREIPRNKNGKKKAIY